VRKSVEEGLRKVASKGLKKGEEKGEGMSRERE
jgi:hypothetical protein